MEHNDKMGRQGHKTKPAAVRTERVAKANASRSILTTSTSQGWCGSAIILSMAFLVYIPALRAGFVWDDDAYVTKNAVLRTPQGLADIWLKVSTTPQYYPMVFSTFWIEYHLWGLNPLGYHLGNVLLHGMAAVLLWFVLRRLAVPGAWLAAAIFTLHPVHVESVAWVTERKNVLSGVFYFAAMRTYFRFCQIDSDVAPKNYRWRAYGLSLALFACALLSKTVTCSLPAGILLLLWWKRGSLSGRDVWPLLPLFAIGLSMGLITAWVEKHHVGASGTEWTLSFVERFLLAGRVPWFYVTKLLLPWPLTFIYPRWEINSAAWWQYLYPSAAILVVSGLWAVRRRTGKGPLVAVLFFVGTLSPALGFFNVFFMQYSFVADHFQYLASAGLIALAGALIAAPAKVVPRSFSPRLKPDMWYIFPGLLLGILAILSWRQSKIYCNLETLWNDTLAKNPRAWIAHNNLGLVLAGQGRIQDAIVHYRKALQLKSDFVEVYNNLAIALVEQKKTDEAVTYYHQALQLNPDHVDTHYNLGIALSDLDRTNEAITHYRRALELKPNHVDARNNLGLAFFSQGKVDEAIDQYRQALELNPDHAEAQYNLGRAFARRGKIEQAIKYYLRAIELKRDYEAAHYSLGIAFAGRGQPNEAIFYFRRALQLKPDHVETYLHLGDALADLGQIDEAIKNYRMAIQHEPDFAAGHNNLGLALVKRTEYDEAILHYREAIRLKPTLTEAYNNLGSLLAAQGKLDEAVGRFRESLRIEPRNADVHCILGDVLQGQGKTEEALAEYREALRIDPQHQTALERLQNAASSPSK